MVKQHRSRLGVIVGCMAGMMRPEPLADALADMARDLLVQETMQETLDRVVDYAVRLVDGCESAGLMVLRGGQVQTLAATDDLAREAERLQGEFGEGPCLDAYQQSEPVFRVAEVATGTDRWPDWESKAAELGIGATMGFVLFTGEDRQLGALNLYSTVSGAFTPRSEQVGLLLASHAAVAFAGVRHTTNLGDAIATRQSIGEAVGIVMERHKVTSHAAFGLLTRVSQNTNTKMREIADQIAHTGQIPGLAETSSSQQPFSGGD